ncbi:hypothetical protein LTR56_002669 [Elasticomyces elasticus]|nr:hypothetical protein LTR22_014916 [Elasticomyces elasticus]KAK3657153.1 hypothetical protein LTR56_002669 [Elasticomyces elasticus]KAK4914375.1 hypothetical protein LTR49_017406 [Elasticomyces elasticus]KAK5753844.1 hypothetical protein LTS12_016047 [Elasticomyces elasticus]
MRPTLLSFIGATLLMAGLPFTLAEGTVTFEFYNTHECKGLPFQTHKSGVFDKLHELDGKSKYLAFKMRDVSQSLFNRDIRAFTVMPGGGYACTWALSNNDHACHTFDPGEFYGIVHSRAPACGECSVSDGMLHCPF